MSYVEVAALAGELGVKTNDVLKVAKKLDISASRGDAKLAMGQAQRIRLYVAEGAERRADERAVRARYKATVATAPKQGGSTEGAAPVSHIGPEYPCACCGLNMGRPREVWLFDTPRRCVTCGDHFEMEGEDEARTVARLRDHETRLRQGYRGAWAEAESNKAKVKNAYRSRDSWRGALVETIIEHAPSTTTGGCKCGSKKFPCFTLNALEASNRKIAKNVEDFCAQPDDQRESYLWPDGYAD